MRGSARDWRPSAAWHYAAFGRTGILDEATQSARRSGSCRPAENQKKQGSRAMQISTQGMLAGAVLAIGAGVIAAPAAAQPVDTARIAAGSPNDWLTYHGSYNGWNYSGLDPDQREQRAGPGRGLDPCPRQIDARPAVDAAGCRRRALLHGLVQPRVRAERRHGRGDLVVFPRARRGAGRPADPLAVQPRRGARRGQGVRRHRRRAADRAGYEDRQAGLGHQAAGFRRSSRSASPARRCTRRAL